MKSSAAISPVRMLTIAALVSLGCALAAGAGDAPRPAASPAAPAAPAADASDAAVTNGSSLHSFASQVDLTSLGRVAVHSEGRLKSLESFCRAAMQIVSGSRLVNDQPAIFTYFDLMLRPKDYDDVDLVYFKQ